MNAKNLEKPKTSKEESFIIRSRFQKDYSGIKSIGGRSEDSSWKITTRMKQHFLRYANFDNIFIVKQQVWKLQLSSYFNDGCDNLYPDIIFSSTSC